ncbi:AAA family ATPase [Wenjunlia tyrosinilytica]|uniref:ATPase AAA n=1 Tax=Wenjunlia tyrosinilytica TaxID=1544741 RepID=A0A917ZJU0_9ACTN|nr:MoxR family ATPase [Wenjunlia tyrosinilytica]GGO84225.1 ATPase AAA [Wenjunlia tyrosinilytica]
MLQYDKEFDPDAPGDVTAGGHGDGTAERDGYAADDEVYVFDDERLVLAVNVALKTGRPLLVFGPPGSGKSSLAPNVARILRWRTHTHVVTARTEPEDLLWRFDALRRLNDAQAHNLNEDISHYYARGPLWEAFADASTHRSVVLIDEIDKADPDLPNSLLGPLGSHSFRLPWGDMVEVAEEDAPLVVITTNDERELPRPFLRRCIIVELDPPGKEHLMSVAATHLGAHYDGELAAQVADHLIGVRDRLEDSSGGPSTAEYLDALKASHRLGVVPGTGEWKVLADVTLRKRREGLEHTA